jgi:hypothetical protein
MGFLVEFDVQVPASRAARTRASEAPVRTRTRGQFFRHKPCVGRVATWTVELRRVSSCADLVNV